MSGTYAIYDEREGLDEELLQAIELSKQEVTQPKENYFQKWTKKVKEKANDVKERFKDPYKGKEYILSQNTKNHVTKDC
jgi:hypothetical protein